MGAVKIRNRSARIARMEIQLLQQSVAVKTCHFRVMWDMEISATH